MVKYIAAAVLAVVAVALSVLAVRQHRDGRMTGAQLALTLGGGVSALVCAGGIALV